jgi:hypothetical protein
MVVVRKRTAIVSVDQSPKTLVEGGKGDAEVVMVGRMEEAMVQIIQYKDARVKIQRRRRS